MKGCANPTVSPAAQDDPTGASEVTNAEGAQQAVWVQLNLIFLVCAHVKKRHRPLDSSQFSIFASSLFTNMLIMYILSHLLILSILCICSCYAAKADKKAAQVKILQQEHKRQVCVCLLSGRNGNPAALHLPSLLCVCFSGARGRATSHGTQNTHEVRICVFVFKWTVWYLRLAITSPRDSAFRERERREKERDEWERQYGRQSHSPSPSKYGKSFVFWS